MKPTTLIKTTQNNYTWSALDGTQIKVNDRQIEKICSITKWSYSYTEHTLHNLLKDGGYWILTITDKQDQKIKKALGWTQPKRGF